MKLLDLKAWEKCSFLIALILALSFGLAVCTASAGDYPNRSVSLIIPWPAGGATDMLGRLMSFEVEKILGEKVIVVNKVGGGVAVGHDFGARAKPDGYTITLATTECSTIHLLGLAPISYKDFDPLLLIATGPGGLGVLMDSPYKNFEDLVMDAKKRPGQIRIASTPVAAIFNLCAVGVANAAGINLNILPYAGGGPAVVAALGGHADAVGAGFSEILPQAKDKKMRYLGITSGKRNPAFPDAPTFKEQGYDIELGAWWGICIPKNTPPDIRSTIHDAFKKAIHTDKIKNMLFERGFVFDYKGPEEFSEWLDKTDKVFRRILKNN